MKLKIFTVLGFVLLLQAIHLEAAVIYVNVAQTNSIPDGTSWSTAFPNIGSAIDAASGNDSVWVARGTYLERLTITNDVALYGGFSGGELDLNQRNWNTNVVILDGQQSNSVVSILATANVPRLDGFVIKNGRANEGGGIYCVGIAPILVNNVVTLNFATNHGGGIFCITSSALIASNLIQENIVNDGLYSGAGIDCGQSAAKIFNNRIIGNSNLGTYSGNAGGIACSGGVSPEIINNLLLANTAIHNIIGANAGGIGLHSVDSPRILNNTIIHCQTGTPAGGGILCDNNSATVANNIIAFCSGGVSGVSGMALTNNCVFGNGSDYSGLPNQTGTNGNISVDPQFALNSWFPDFHILATSPCRDAGDSLFATPGVMDLEGDSRVIGTALDIGADEFNGAAPIYTPAIVRVSTTGNDGNDGLSWENAKRTVQAGIDAVAFQGGEVWVASGVYPENLTLRHFVYLYGGFSGVEANRAERNWTANPTILDGGQSASVITAVELQKWNAIDGFVIRNGKATAGAGIYCSESATTIAHNLISNNVATPFNPTPNGLGGGVYCAASKSLGAAQAITNNTFYKNQAVVGGGICCAGFRSSTLIANNRFEANSVVAVDPLPGFVANGGGGVFVYQSAKPNLEGNYFLNNVSTNKAGTTTLSGGKGGAVCVDSSAAARIVNNTMVGNLATSSSGPYLENGGGVFSQSAGTVIANNLIAFGSSGIYTGHYASDPDYNLLQNNCIFGNASNYLRMPDLTGTNRNISMDPLLVATNNYQLSASSPCINSGSNGWITATIDIDGNPRIAGPLVDIGAYEFPSPTSELSYGWLQQYGLPTDGSVDYVDTDGDGANNWLEWLYSSDPTNALSAPYPVIVSQPSPLTIVRGLTASFTVGAVGPNLTYQWQFNETNIPNAVTSSYTITNVQPSDVGNYRVRLTNVFGITWSSNAPLELGELAAWGYNGFGQTTVPTGATNLLAVAGGDEFTAWLKSNGSMKGWGSIAYAQTNFPPDLTNVIAISAGNQCILVLKADGTVAGFGAQYPGDVPVGLNGIVALAQGLNHGLALKNDGQVVAWGYNPYGQTSVPLGLSNVVAIAAGEQHSLALKADGTVVGWGDNGFGQTNVPPGLHDVVAIAAGSLHSLALKSDGTVIAWGSLTQATNVPVGLSNVVAIASGLGHCLALREDGTVVAWGRNEQGQTNVPPGLTNVVAISCGDYHSLALVAEKPEPSQTLATVSGFDVGGFNISIPSRSGRVYRLEYQDSLGETNWNPLWLAPGNGGNLHLVDPATNNVHRFYRVRRW